MLEIVKQAALIVGGPSKLATIIGVKRQALYAWDEVPPKRVIPIEQATAGKITRSQMRPDLYPADNAT